MNKKLISLLLAMVMVLGMLSGCATKSGEEENVTTTDSTEVSDRVAMTLTLALPSDNFTEESRQQVEDAINRLTTAKYDTAIELKLYPRDEYRDAYMAQLAEITKTIEEQEAAEKARREELKELKKQGITVEETEETEETQETEEETIINDLGISIKQYPDVNPTQFDIFLVTSFEDYNYLIDNDLIQNLTSEVSSTSKILNTYIYPTFLEVANVSGLYAIPNNHPVGEYQWLLVNKELVDTYYYDPNKLKTLLTCKDFIMDMASMNLEGVTPLLGKVETPNMVYWGEDQSEWSVIASQLTNTTTQITRSVPKNIFSVAVYTNTLKMMLELDKLGYIGDGVIDEGEKFVVGVVSGDTSVYDKYGDDYYIQIYSKPVCTRDDVFNSMFAVSSYSASLTRSMEIITYLNTSKDIRTVLQYGAEGIQWEYDDEDTQETIKILKNDYQMKLTDTGNVYMTYPGEGRSMDEWEYAKQQNIDAIVSPYMMFTQAEYINDANRAQIQQMTAISKTYKQKLDALTLENFDDGIATLKEELAADEVVSALLDGVNNENSITMLYSDWYAVENAQ